MSVLCCRVEDANASEGMTSETEGVSAEIAIGYEDLKKKTFVETPSIARLGSMRGVLAGDLVMRGASPEP